jgi:hypothetical protein
MKSAVEWYKNELNKIELTYMNKVIDRKEYMDLKSKAFEQAKEMEKQQIIDAFNEAEDKCEYFIEEHAYQRYYRLSEQYYNETFKSE